MTESEVIIMKNPYHILLIIFTALSFNISVALSCPDIPAPCTACGKNEGIIKTDVGDFINPYTDGYLVMPFKDIDVSTYAPLKFFQG